MKYYLVAGERSGDLHGSNLLKSLKQVDPDASFRGIGGGMMQDSGLDILIHYSNLAFMGFWEVFKNLGTIQKYLKEVKSDIVVYQPDVLILIDYPGFNLRLAKFAHAKGIKVYYYISPKIWAWNTKRAYKIRKWVDKVFSILPFEEEFYHKYDVKVDYVGNPVMDAVNKFSFDEDFASSNKINPDQTISILPGSRKQEVNAFVPEIISLVTKMPEYTFTISVVDNLPEEIYNPLRTYSNVRLILGNTYDLLKNSSAAVVTSGTATLETAILDVPQVVCYKMSPITYSIAKRLVKVDYISLVNLIMGKEVVKELIQTELNTLNLTNELKLILNDQNYSRKMLSNYDELRSKLGNHDVSEFTARKMYNYLTE